MLINKSIFKAYDIRGIVEEDLNKEVVTLIGKAIGTYSILKGEKEFVVGRDGRLTSASLFNDLTKGIMSTGCFIVNIGVVPTPVTYFATKKTNATSAVMITGSHNPPQYNGFKIVIKNKTLSGDEVMQLYRIIKKNDFIAGNGLITNTNIDNYYINSIIGGITLKKKLKVVIDCGNGVAGKIAPILYKKLGCLVDELYSQIDGNFPNHHPDPSNPENLTALIARVKTIGADVGLAFDGDGDRLGVIDNLGNIVWADKQMMLYAKDILMNNHNAKIVFDVKCSAQLKKYITKLGGTAIMSKTGHSFIKSMISRENAALGGEMSGHIFFNDRWFGFDDALYTGARLLEILSAHKESLFTMFNKMPHSVSTPEINIHFQQPGKQFVVMQKLLNNYNFAGGIITTIDGLRVDYDYGFGLVRPSNTTPCLVLRFEADNTNNLAIIKNNFKIWLANNGIECDF